MEIRSKLGNENIMQMRKTAFFCSRKEPSGLQAAVDRWIATLQPDKVCVMCGDQSPMEKHVFSLLLERKIPAILVLAEAMHEQWSEPVSAALGSGQLLIITHCGPEVHTVCARSAFDRNALMMALADEIVVGYCSKGGNLERGLAGYSNVRYLVGNQANRAKTKEPLPQQGGRSYAGRRFPDDSQREKSCLQGGRSYAGRRFPDDSQREKSSLQGGRSYNGRSFSVNQNASNGFGQGGRAVAGQADNGIGQWSRRLDFGYSTIFFDFNEAGKDVYIKLTQSTKSADGKYERNKIFMDRTEFRAFYDTIGYVTRTVERDEKLDKNIVVRSASGDISLNMVMSEGIKMCMMTQEKELLTMGHRRQTIGFCVTELSAFFDVVIDAARHWRIIS